MQKNNLSSLDKCIILLSYVNDKNPPLFVKIIESNPRNFTRLKEELPIYNKEEVHQVLEEYNDLTVEKTMLFPNESFKDHLQKKLFDVDCEKPMSNHQKSAFLETISIQSILKMVNQEPNYFIGLLCHMMTNEEFAQLLSQIPHEQAKNGLRYYTKMSISNLDFLSELTEFYIDRIQKSDVKTHKTTDSQTQDLAHILELLPDANKEAMKAIIPPDISWNIIEKNLLSVEDIQFYPPKDQHLILSSIRSSEELAKTLSIIPSHIRIKLMKECLTPRQFNIVSEEIELLKANPLSEKDIAMISNAFIKHMRKLQHQNMIVGVEQYKKAAQ